MTRLRAGLLVLVALPLLGAEGGGCTPDREVPVTVLRAGAQCGGEGTGASVRRLGSADELAAAFRSDLGGGPPPAADLEAGVVLLISSGRRPTAGFSVELGEPKAPVKGGVALVQVALREPGPGAVVAQVVTSPCLVVQLPKAGLQEVEVADGVKRLIGSAPVR